MKRWQRKRRLKKEEVKKCRKPVAMHRSLAEAVTKFMDSLHHIYSGINIKPISNEIRIPKNLSVDQVLEFAIRSASKLKMSMIYLFFRMLFMSNKEGGKMRLVNGIPAFHTRIFERICLLDVISE